ncbi:MAG: Hsp33 family molecular chaperone HslO [Oscillospiraceae bacterium]
MVIREIAEDITNYFAVSEQIPTVCGLGVLVNPNLTVQAAGGFLVQLLPGASEETIARLEENVRSLEPVSKMLANGSTPQQIAFRVLDGFAPQVLDEFNTEYRCDCSRARVERALLSMGRGELEDMAQEREVTQVECHFCEKVYSFTSKDLRELAKN